MRSWPFPQPTKHCDYQKKKKKIIVNLWHVHVKARKKKKKKTKKQDGFIANTNDILDSSIFITHPKKKNNEIKTFYIANIHYGTYSIRLPYYIRQQIGHYPLFLFKLLELGLYPLWSLLN